MEQIVIIIPAYEPDDRLLTLLTGLKEQRAGFIILVNDGSKEPYDELFHKAGTMMGNEGMILNHGKNCGKGRALKTAFLYVTEHIPQAAGVITADSDGQHTPEDILKIRKALLENPGHLILGVREFTGAGIPWKSRIGNCLTEKIFSYVSGVHVSDTQTGLRGIPASLLKPLIHIKGDRFEFEMRMLLECAGTYPVTEVAVETVYDSKENHQTHFRPVTDSLRIYRILGKKVAGFAAASISSCMMDVLLFVLFCRLFLPVYPDVYMAVATVAARILSAGYNYFVNYAFVFHSKEPVKTAGMKYTALAAVQMGLSAAVVTLSARIFPFVPEVAVKVAVDTGLFFISYYVQQRFIMNCGQSRRR